MPGLVADKEFLTTVCLFFFLFGKKHWGKISKNIDPNFLKSKSNRQTDGYGTFVAANR